MAKFKNFVFDQNIFTTHWKKIGNSPLLLAKIHFSSVVLYELTATTISADDLDIFENWRKFHDKNETLITPDKNDWWETAKVIRRLRFGDKSASHGLTPKLQHAHRLQNDALIARTALWQNAMLLRKTSTIFSSFYRFCRISKSSATSNFSGKLKLLCSKKS